MHMSRVSFLAAAAAAAVAPRAVTYPNSAFASLGKTVELGRALAEYTG